MSLFTAIVSAIKKINTIIADSKEQSHRESLKQGLETGDTKKIEDSFDSPSAGKPSGENVDTWND